MELSNALKSLLATLATKTTADANDGVMLLDLVGQSPNNPAPNGKITIKSLAATINALGATSWHGVDNIANIREAGMYLSTPTTLNRPADYYYAVMAYKYAPDPTNIYPLFAIETNGASAYQGVVRGTNVVWHKVSFDVPAFYNSYANLAALTSAVYKGQWYGDCTTAADTAAKTCTISGFLAVPTSVVTVHFASAINVAASELNATTATLNISSTGAKPIKYKGVPVQPGVVRAGNLVTMQYDGTNYNIIGIEGLESSAVPSNLYVDMGLPSGTLWATRNVDITQPNGFAASEYQYECSFFSWGNTEGHNPTSTSSFSPYDWGNANDGVYASTEGSKIMGQLTASQDFARANCGAPWRLPTAANFTELFANIEYIDAQGSVIASSTADKRTTMSGITGLRIRSTVNGNIIFIPSCGSGSGTSWSSSGGGGFYWSSSLGSSTSGRNLFFGSSSVSPQDSSSRFVGFACRPVQ